MARDEKNLFQPLSNGGRTVTDFEATAEDALLEVGNSCFLRIFDQRYFVDILGVSQDTIWVSFHMSDFPLEGMGVDLEFHQGGGFTCYHTRVSIPPKEAGDGVVLQRAEAATFMAYRRSWRVPVDLAMKAREHPDGEVWDGRLVDISAEGALAVSAKALEVGDMMSLSFALPGGRMATMTAQVIHSRVDDEGVVHMGLRFDDVPATTREALTSFLWREIRERYPSELEELYPPSKSRKKKRKKQPKR